MVQWHNVALVKPKRRFDSMLWAPNRKVIMKKTVEYDYGYIPYLIAETAVEGLVKKLNVNLKKEYNKNFQVKRGYIVWGKKITFTVNTPNGPYIYEANIKKKNNRKK